MKIVAAYIRVSTNDQTEYSPESQIDLLRDYAKKNDMILPEEFIFRDDGISGRTAEKRPEFMRMIGVAKTKPKPFESILLWKFSRFARNREDAILYKSMLRKDLGIDVVSISENIGDDKMSILIEAMIEAMDEYYSINLSEEVRRGMSERAKRGECVSVAPFGYYIKDKKLIVDNEKSKTVRKIYANFLADKSMHSIANELNTLGVKTTKGKLWRNKTIRYVLTNPVYNGKIRWNPNGINDYTTGVPDPNTIITEGIHEEIISNEDFEKVQTKLRKYLKMFESSNSKRKGNEVASTNGDYMLRGLLKCSACGSSMTRVKDGLNCVNYAHSVCKESHYVSMNKIIPLVFSTMIYDMDSLEFDVVQKTSSIELSNEIELINSQITKLKAVLSRHKEAYANGIDSIQEYKQNKENVSSKIIELENKLKKSPAPQIDKKAYAEQRKRDIKKLQNPNTTETEKNKILRSFVDKIIFERKTCSVEIFYYF